MNTAGIRTEDIVRCDVRGDTFYGVVTHKGRAEDARLKPRELRVRPISIGRGESRIVTSRQVVGHYRKAKGSR